MKLIKIARPILMFTRHIRWMGLRHPFWLVRNPRQPLITGEQQRRIDSILWAGDTILSRTDGYFSTWMVPGFFTHAGVYLGHFGKAHQVSEAVGEGVRPSDVLDFTKEDYIVVMRALRLDDVLYAITKAREITVEGREYDHLFDFDSEERICCTELVQCCYPKHRFGKRRWGRYSVTADDIYQYAKDHPDEFEIIYDSRCDNANV